MGNYRSYPLPTPEELIWRLFHTVHQSMNQDPSNPDPELVIKEVSELTGIEEETIWKVYDDEDSFSDDEQDRCCF